MLVLALITLYLTRTYSQEVIPVNNLNDITIAFGSCLSTFDEEEHVQTALTSIIQTQPDLWMWIGDAIYLDGESFFYGSLPGAGYDVSDASFVQNVFNGLKTNQHYLALMNTAPIIGVWDDHDYAYNDADGSFEFKERNKGFFLDFLDEPANSNRRNQQGVYTSYYIGQDKFIKVILLDVRYNRTPDSTISDLLGIDLNSRFDDMLGEEQWAWLDNELQDPNGVYTLIVSATQFLTNDRPILPNWYRDSLERLISLINTHQKSGVVLLSGDVHFAEMIKDPCPGRVGYKNFHEFTSSGMTHSASLVDLFDGIITTYSAESDRYFGKNFAVLKFAREENSATPPNLIFEARDAEGNLVLTREVVYSDLVYDATLVTAGCNAGGSDASDNSADGNPIQNVVDTVEEVKNGVENVVDTGKDILGGIGNIFDKKKI